MLARCSRCSATFVTDRYGRQRCPNCRAEVLIRDPNEPQPPAVPAEVPGARPPPSAPPADAWAPPREETQGPPEEHAIPWERRAELGLWKALTQTLGQALGDPNRFFERMRYGTAEGALLWFCIVGIVPAVIGSLLSTLLQDPAEQTRMLEEVYRSMGNEEAARQLEQVLRTLEPMQSPAGAVLGTIVTTPPTMLLMLYAGAGASHLVLLLFNRAHGGWVATFKVFAYASSPFVLFAVPFCGAIIALLWSAVLDIVGLAKAHRISGGWATAAVVLPSLALACCCGGAMLLLFMAVMSAMGGLS